MVNSPSEESAGGVRRTDDGCSDAAGGGGRLTNTDGVEAKGKIKKESKQANCRGKGTRVNLGGGEKGRGGAITIIRTGIIAN